MNKNLIWRLLAAVILLNGATSCEKEDGGGNGKGLKMQLVQIENGIETPVENISLDYRDSTFISVSEIYNEKGSQITQPKDFLKYDEKHGWYFEYGISRYEFNDPRVTFAVKVYSDGQRNCNEWTADAKNAPVGVKFGKGETTPCDKTIDGKQYLAQTTFPITLSKYGVQITDKKNRSVSLRNASGKEIASLKFGVDSWLLKDHIVFNGWVDDDKNVWIQGVGKNRPKSKRILVVGGTGQWTWRKDKDAWGWNYTEYGVPKDEILKTYTTITY